MAKNRLAMTRFAVFLALLFLFSCSKKADETAPAVVGRWTLVAQQDSTGVWTNFIPFVPVQFEFRVDGSFDYMDLAGRPKRECCQPTRYSFIAGTPATVPASSSYRVNAQITFTDWVSCPTVKCVLPRTWTVVQVSDQFLDLDQSESQGQRQRFRYQRVR